MSAAVLFDPVILQRRRAACAPLLDRHGFLFDAGWDRLCERLGDVRRSFSAMLALGARHSPARHLALQQLYPGARVVLADQAEPLLQRHGGENMLWSENTAPLPAAAFDLVLCNGFLHTVNDVPGVLAQIRRTLKPDGLFLAALPGGRTLPELRDSFLAADMAQMAGAGPRLIPFIDRAQAAALMQRAGFALPVVDAETLVVTYGNMNGLLRDLRNMGESNVLRDRPPRPGLSWLRSARDHYHRNHADADGRLRASIEIIFMTGWAPHESQQKPLPRGSGQIDLSDIL